MDTLTITITRKVGSHHIINVDVPPKSFWGQNFFKNERNFVSSDGFVISSANYRVQAHPRVGHFTFPDKPLKSNDRIGDAPKDRWFIEFLIKAIEEFNSAQNEKQIVLINK